MDPTWRIRKWIAGMLALWLVLCAFPAHAEYADVVLNRRAEKEGVRPVVFPHWFHRCEGVRILSPTAIRPNEPEHQ
jgi:hypothetical protein